MALNAVRLRTAVIACAAAAALVGLYAVIPRGPSGPQSGPKTYRIVLHHGRLDSSPPVLDVVEGDSITLMVLSDEPATLHVHEYEQQFVLPLTPNVPATSTFRAARAGRFPVHVIGIDPWHPEVAVIQVHPR